MRIALLQCAPKPLDVSGNLARLDRYARNAAAWGAKLLVTPEMFISGYNIGSDHVARLAEASDGGCAQTVADIARRYGLAIAYGYPELGREGKIYNSVQLINREGHSLGNYRKTHLFGELDRKMFSAGTDYSPIIEFEGWNLGILICYDIEFPENARRHAIAGADLLLVPTANMKPYDFVAQVTVRSRAYENQCFVAYANYCGREDEILYCGQSSVSAPDGSVLGMANDIDEDLLVIDLERELINQLRSQACCLKDRRADLYIQHQLS
ncbi:carbon-nitrogen hydrolase family protein [Pseudomonas asiatica]|uniref:carbon-nitrogen hydrolase family protein n=1 Tax=Pseudomonas asiatica TaxID=2219225 RepID=UPI0025AB011A|nr:carbon-nitrogen hydrolase family protein [Pseudomonas asiatica]MDM9590468.1 carbon-nitrogen hydrolase family protein [Pseudomonas asiatica]